MLNFFYKERLYKGHIHIRPKNEKLIIYKLIHIFSSFLENVYPI